MFSSFCVNKTNAGIEWSNRRMHLFDGKIDLIVFKAFCVKSNNFLVNQTIYSSKLENWIFFRNWFKKSADIESIQTNNCQQRGRGRERLTFSLTYGPNFIESIKRTTRSGSKSCWDKKRDETYFAILFHGFCKRDTSEWEVLVCV